jgi:hypothetical protein
MWWRLRLSDMTRSYRRARWAAAYVLIAALATACSAGSVETSRPTSPDPPLVSTNLTRPGQFISLRFAPAGPHSHGAIGPLEVAVSDVQNGAIVRRLLPANYDGMTVDGLSLDRSGNLWITYTKGPYSQGDLAGGDPKPHSCANEIAILHASTGRISVCLRTGDNVLLGGATVNPDGNQIAYAESGCATGYFNSYLRVTDIHTRRSWTIGRTLARCHFLFSQAWSSDGRALLVAYAPHIGSAYTGAQGTCAGIGTERLVELRPTAQPGLAGRGMSAGRGCQITSVAGTAGGGAVAIAACGGSNDISGPARLLVLGDHLNQIRRITLGRCTDGNELNANREGRSVLVSAYLFCNPPGKPGPITKLWSYSGGKLRLITTAPGGSLAESLMTW